MAKEKKLAAEGASAASTPEVMPASAQGYETFDPEEAQKYNLRAGGHLIAVTARFPSNDPNVPSFRPGKRYRFLETKAELEKMLVAAGEG